MKRPGNGNLFCQALKFTRGWSFAFEPTGYPIQTRGVTPLPGLYFVGLNWLYKYKSTLLVGVGEDAEYVANHLLTRSKSESIQLGF